jgi:hypothetical protein
MPSPLALYITGLGHQYPPYLMTPDKFDQLAARFHDTERPGYVPKPTYIISPSQP